MDQGVEIGARSIGARVLRSEDPRILTGHLQPIYRPSMRPPEKLSIAALKRIVPPPLYRVLVEAGAVPP